jgi:hypothetical protein
MLKKEVVLALIKVGLRWGGQDFGDMMHFDMGFEILNEFYDVAVAHWASQSSKLLGTKDDVGLQKLRGAALHAVTPRPPCRPLPQARAPTPCRSTASPPAESPRDSAAG